MDSKKCKIKFICVGYRSREIADLLNEDIISGVDVVKCNAGASEESLKSLLDNQPDIVAIFVRPVGTRPYKLPIRLARMFKDAGIVTIGMIALPFIFEGERNLLGALDLLDELSRYTDAVMTINLQKLLGDNELYGYSDPTPSEAIAQICFQQLSNLSNLMDSSESIAAVVDILKDCGTFYTFRVEGKGDHPISKAISQVFHDDDSDGSLIDSRPRFDFSSAQKCIIKILVNETTGTEATIRRHKDLALLTSELSDWCEIAVSFGVDPTLDEGVKIIMLLTTIIPCISPLN